MPEIPNIPSILSEQLRLDSIQSIASRNSVQIRKSNFSQNGILGPGQGAGFQRINCSILKSKSLQNADVSRPTSNNPSATLDHNPKLPGTAQLRQNSQASSSNRLDLVNQRPATTNGAPHDDMYGESKSIK